MLGIHFDVFVFFEVRPRDTSASPAAKVVVFVFLEDLFDYIVFVNSIFTKQTLDIALDGTEGFDMLPCGCFAEVRYIRTMSDYIRC